MHSGFHRLRFFHTTAVLKAAVFLCLFFFFVLPASADVYRWVDKEGVVHYTDTPPAQDAEEIHRYPELSSESPAAESDPRDVPRSPEIAAPTETTPEPTPSPEPQAPSDTETMIRLKKNLEKRTSSHQQRKFKRRIEAQKLKEGIEPGQDANNP